MLAVFVNMACVFIGSLLGIFFRSRLRVAPLVEILPDDVIR